MSRKLLLGLLIFSFVLQPLVLLAQQDASTAAAKKEDESKKTADTKTLDEVQVKATAEMGHFLPDVQGTKIYAGKNTQLIDLQEFPDIQNNNYREALIQVPGLNLSEETTPLVSIGYRGLNPDRTQFMQVLKDGVPIAADMFGYPESYYTPILQSVDDIQFIHGGSALLYGPQPGGALNYVSKKPLTDTPFLAFSENAFGTDDYFSTYNVLTGTVGKVGYYGYFHERQSEGFRTANSDYEVIAGSFKTVINQKGKTRLTLVYDEYHEQHGEPGGETRAGAFRPNYDQNRRQATRLFDRFELERYYGYAILEHEFSENTQLDLRVYGGKYRRFSQRQRGGGFGTYPNINNNDIQDHYFYNMGFEPRLRHNYEFLGGKHTLTVGTHTFLAHSPRYEFRGFSAQTSEGVPLINVHRDNWYFAPFLENLFKWGPLSIVPGVRIENLWQRVREIQNTGKRNLATNSEYSVVPLFGIGVMYEVARGIEAYGNISQSYRPQLFTQSVPLGVNEVISGDLKEGYGVQYDFGVRGNPVSFLSWNADYFLLTFDDQIGTVGNLITNVGDIENQGMELFTEIDLPGAVDYFKKTDLVKNIGSVKPFIAYTLLNGKIKNGRNEGRSPAFAPRYQVKTGFNYKWRDRVKLSLFATFVDEQFADDAGTVNRFIPSYKVWDLLTEVNMFPNFFNALQDVTAFGGVNNLFDEEYYSRITGSGIDPAYPRNFYLGVKASWGFDGESKSGKPSYVSQPAAYR